MDTSRAERYEKLEPGREQRLIQMMSYAPFPSYLGICFEEVRKEYGRARLPYRPELNQPAGMVHGGVLATLIDTVVVCPLFSTLESLPRKLLTIDLHIHYLDAVIEQDMIAEGWTRTRGRSTAFVAAEVFNADGKLCAHGEMAYRIVM